MGPGEPSGEDRDRGVLMAKCARTGPTPGVRTRMRGSHEGSRTGSREGSCDRGIGGARARVRARVQFQRVLELVDGLEGGRAIGGARVRAGKIAICVWAQDFRAAPWLPYTGCPGPQRLFL
jgi:hypothetical protein